MAIREWQEVKCIFLLLKKQNKNNNGWTILDFIDSEFLYSQAYQLAVNPYSLKASVFSCFVGSLRK